MEDELNATPEQLDLKFAEQVFELTEGRKPNWALDNDARAVSTLSVGIKAQRIAQEEGGRDKVHGGHLN